MAAVVLLPHHGRAHRRRAAGHRRRVRACRRAPPPRPTSPWSSSAPTAQWESEGHDRPDLSLPGRQRELVEAVLDVNPRTVVVVNAGSPVEMPWAERAGAVLMTWYPGEEGADALADILVGRVRADGPTARHVPGPRRGRAGGSRCRGRPVPRRRGQGRLREGVLVGYRFFETARLAPLFPFGFGLSYGDIVFEEVAVTPERVTVRLVNEGAGGAPRSCRCTSGRSSRRVRRPDRELAGFAKVVAGRRAAGDGRGRAGRRRLPLLGRRRRTAGARTRVATRCSSARRRATSGRAPRSPGAPTPGADRRDGGTATTVRTGTSEAPRPWTLTWDRLLVEPRRPEVIRERPDAHWFAVAAVCVGAFMGQLDASIVTVALPTLQHTFDVSVGAVTWVGLSYLLVLVATVTAVGRFADMWGRKLLYVYGFVIFTARLRRSAAWPPTSAALCGFRALQAVGAAMLQANSLAIIVLVVPARSLGRAIGLQGAAQALGLALGPIDRRAAPRRRRLAPHLLRQRPLRPLRRPGGDPAGAAEPQPDGPGALRLDRARRSSSRRWWRSSRPSPSGPSRAGARR